MRKLVPHENFPLYGIDYKYCNIIIGVSYGQFQLLEEQCRHYLRHTLANIDYMCVVHYVHVLYLSCGCIPHSQGVII